MRRLLALALLALCVSMSALPSAKAGDVPFPGAAATPTPTPECGQCNTGSTSMTTNWLIEVVLFVLYRP